MKKRWLKICCCLISLSMMTGCWSARELNSLSIVIGIGIDKKPNTSNYVVLTAEIVKPDAMGSGTGKSGGGGGDKAYWNLQSDSDTVFDAIREFTHLTSNRLYTAHAELFIIGRDIAQEGIVPYLDFFVRAVETRPTTVIVISDTTAEEMMNVEPKMDKLPVENITKLVEAQTLTSYAKKVDLQDYIAAMLSKTKSFVAPMVFKEQSNGEDILSVQQMAVFKKDKMVGKLTYDETRGLLWTLGEVQTGVVDIPYEDGTVSFEIKNASTDVNVQLIDDKIQVNININQECILSAQTCSQNLAKTNYFKILEGLIDDAVKDEIMAAILKAKELNTDYFGFGEKLGKTPPENWKDIESNWDYYFPKMAVKVAVKSTILSAGVLTSPTLPESDE